jgi:hypothetical protein
VGREEGRSETKGMESDRNKLAEKRKYHIEKGHEYKRYGITYTCTVCEGRGRVGRWRGIYEKHMGRDGIDKGR